MSQDKTSKSISWEAFQSMGNPENVEDEQETGSEESTDNPDLQDVIRVYVERKGRGGKTVSIIKGLTLEDNDLIKMCKTLKSKCGVGGSVENNNIVIQGDQRKRLIKELHIMGYTNVKNAGA